MTSAMRKTSVLATASILLALLAASEASAQRISLGARAGANRVGAWFEDELANGWAQQRWGFHFGGVSQYELHRVVAVQLEARYTQKGWAEFHTGGGRKIEFLEFPLLLNVRLPTRLSPHLLFGPVVGFELGCTVTELPGVGAVGCDDTAIALRRRKLDFGTIVGIGIGYPIGKGTLFVDALGNIGLRDLNGEPTPPGYMRLVTGYLSAGFMLPVGR
jgi:hypothetical protein